MRKSVSVHYELMFTRPLFQTADIEAQHRLLNEIISKMRDLSTRSPVLRGLTRPQQPQLRKSG